MESKGKMKKCAYCGKEFKRKTTDIYCSEECRKAANKIKAHERYEKNAKELKRRHGLYRKAIREGRRANILDLQEYVKEVGETMLNDIEHERFVGGVPELERTLRAVSDLLSELKTLSREAHEAISRNDRDTALKVSHIRGAARSLVWVSQDLALRARALDERIESYYR